MTSERLQVRLGAERRRKLEELAKLQGVPMSEAFRRIIDQAYSEMERAPAGQRGEP